MIKGFSEKRDHVFKTYVGTPTPFIKLDNLTDHLGGAQIYAKVVSEANGRATRFIMLLFIVLLQKSR